MTTPPNLRAAIAAALLLASASAYAAKGHLGFGIQAETSGLFSPTLKRVTISKVAPGSPAASAGLRAGDDVVEIEGQQVVGAAARPMAARLDVQIGQHVHLKVRRAGAVLPLEIVAGR